MIRRLLITGVLVGGLATATVAPALASHDHFMITPNGKCHQVAAGQTGIGDAGHGGYHRYHYNVHKGAAASGTLGSSRVAVQLGC